MQECDIIIGVPKLRDTHAKEVLTVIEIYIYYVNYDNSSLSRKELKENRPQY